MPRSVVYKHLKDSKHDESFQYIDDLVKQFSSPENIVRSKIDRNTNIYNICLINKCKSNASPQELRRFSMQCSKQEIGLHYPRHHSPPAAKT